MRRRENCFGNKENARARARAGAGASAQGGGGGPLGQPPAPPVATARARARARGGAVNYQTPNLRGARPIDEAILVALGWCRNAARRVEGPTQQSLVSSPLPVPPFARARAPWRLLAAPAR